MIKNLILFVFLNILFYGIPQGYAQPRTIITTDGEIDDVDSFIRMLLYSNEFKIEGLIYSSSMWHYKGDGKGTRFISEMDMTKKLYGEKTDLRWPGTEWMNGLIDDYEAVYPRLSQHASGYPTADQLRSLIRIGNIDFEGEMDKITDGSEYIKEKLLDEDLTPLYLQVWGGTNTIARALKSIKDQYFNAVQWPYIYKKVCDKAILYTILDQDATYKKYISIHWPEVKVYYNSNQFGCLAYPWKRLIDSSEWHWLQGKFMSEHIIQHHGPLLENYYSYGDGQKQAGDDEHIHGDIAKLKNTMWGNFERYDFISEGDSPAYLHLIDVGLNNLQNPAYGGWGGRLIRSNIDTNRWEDGDKASDFNPLIQKLDKAYPQTRWLAAIQSDCAARADWCVSEVNSANHPPVIKVKQKYIQVNPGSTITIKAFGNDPDRDKITYSFWHYPEASGTTTRLAIHQKNKTAQVDIPSNIPRGVTFHIIVEGKDHGIPTLTRYQRVILEVI